MKPNLYSFILLAALATPLGGSPITVHTNSPGVGIRVQEIKLPKTPPTRSVSIWNVKSRKHVMVMRWSCTPFEPLSPEGQQADASMWLSPAVPGHKQIRVLKSFDCTNVSSNVHEAHVLAKSAHPGVTRMKLVVGVDDRFSAAGKYCTTVNLSVSAL